jgi:hypothetical protein
MQTCKGKRENFAGNVGLLDAAGCSRNCGHFLIEECHLLGYYAVWLL